MAAASGALLRTAFLSLVAVQSAVGLVETDLPGLAGGDPPVIATAIDAGFLYYCLNTLRGQIIGRDAVGHTTLEGLTSVLRLDVGRESGTWMPNEWGASGARLSLSLKVTFEDEKVDLGFPGEEALNGRFAKRLRCVEGGKFIGAAGEVAVEPAGGAWVATPTSQPGVSKVRFFIEFPESATRNDVTIPAGRVYFSSAVLSDEADAAALVAEGADGAIETPGGALLVGAGGLNVKRNDARNLFGALGDTMLILGRFAVDVDWSSDGASEYGE